MLLDHVVSVFYLQNDFVFQVLKTPGRMAAPVFCYFVAEGYRHTSNRKKYVFRLILFAAISHYPFNLAFGYGFFQATSVIWALAMGLVALSAVKSSRFHLVAKAGIILVCCLAALTANWNFTAVLWVLGFGLFFENFKRQIISFILIGSTTYLGLRFFYFGVQDWYQFGIFLAIPFLAAYNGKLGQKSKAMSWFFYIFYPGHLIILHILRSLIFL